MRLPAKTGRRPRIKNKHALREKLFGRPADRECHLESFKQVFLQLAEGKLRSASRSARADCQPGDHTLRRRRTDNSNRPPKGPVMVTI